MSLVRKNVVANYFGQGWAAIMGLAFVPLYIQYLGLEAFGLIGIFVVMQSLLALLDMGMTPTLTREMAKFTSGAHSPQSIRDLLRSLEVIVVCVAVIIALTVWLTSGYLSRVWLNVDELPIVTVSQAISMMGLVIAMRFIESIYRGALFGLQRQVWYNVVNAVIATLRHGGVLFILAWVAADIQAFFFWQAVISVLSITVLVFGVYQILPSSSLPAKFTFDAISKVWKFAGGMMLVSFLAILLTQFDKILLSRLISLESFAYYMLAATVAGGIYMVIGPITSAFYPRMVEFSIEEKGEVRLTSLYHQGSQLVTLLIAPAAMLLCFFSQDVLFMWSGDASLAEEVAPILSIFVIGVFLNGLMHMPAQLQLAYGWVSLSIKANVVAVTILIPAIYWVVPHYGVIGVAWIWVVLNAGYVIIAIQVMHRRILLNEKWKWYFSDILLPLIGVVGVMFLAKQFKSEIYQDRWNDFIFLLISGGFALIISTLLSNQIRFRLLAYMKIKIKPKA